MEINMSKFLKILSFMLTFAMIFPIVGCNNGGTSQTTTTGGEPSDTNNVPEADPTDEVIDSDVEPDTEPDTEPEPTDTDAATEPELPEGIPTDKTYNILFIGNSYTYYNSMPEIIFHNIVKQSKYSANVESVTKGSWYLKGHADKNDEMGAQVEKKLAEKKWDFVVIQEQSTCPIENPAKFYDGVRALAEKIRANGATPILYCTWGRKKGHSYLSTSKNTNATMTYKLAAAYEAIGRELDIPVAPVGFAFMDVYTEYESTIELYDDDKTHPSKIGSHLAAITIFSTIFGVDPSEATYAKPPVLAHLKVLQDAARNALFNPPEIPEAYITSSEGVTEDPANVNNLTSFPSTPIISVVKGGTYPNGKTFSGILGTSGKIASVEYSANKLTDAQKADIANIENGVSVIGIEKMDSSAKGYTTAIENLVNGHWGSSLMSSFIFDNNKYDINGNVKADGKYRCLITLNFGAKYKFDAAGFFSGSLQGFPGAADIYVSSDGVNWTLVPTACWDAINGTALVNCGKSPSDPWNGNTSAVSCLFNMNGAVGQYVRVGIITGRYDEANKYNTINTREFVVYGTKYE